MSEFTDLTTPFNETYRQYLMEDEVMPAAIVCLTNPNTGEVYSIASASGTLSGLPNYDLAAMLEAETPEQYVSFRMHRRLNFRVPEEDLDFVPAISGITPYTRDIGNKMHPRLHHRAYLPVVGKTDLQPKDSRVVAVQPEAILEALDFPGPTPTQQHLLDIHHQVFDRYMIRS